MRPGGERLARASSGRLPIRRVSPLSSARGRAHPRSGLKSRETEEPMKRNLTLLALAASACLAAASLAGAASAGQLCKPFSHRGLSYQVQTVGTGWTCGSAKTWVIKLSGDKVGKVTKNVPLKNGPTGLHCFANPGSLGGRATAGDCIMGTVAFPK